MHKITNIEAEEIKDSRMNPTIRVSVFSEDSKGSFDVPSGASTGEYEACELRDEDGGKSGVNKAIEKIKGEIKDNLLDKDVTDQSNIDQIMLDLDGTPQKTKLGGNSMVGVSIAAAKTAALTKNLKTYEYLRTLKKIKPTQDKPFLFFNLINGGKHTKTKLAFQEYHIVPQTEDITESVKICQEIEKELDNIIMAEFGENFPKGDEGGVALPIEDVMEPLRLLQLAIDNLDYTEKILLSIDAAASSFYNKETKMYQFMGKDWSTDEMIDLYKDMSSKYKMITIEDPLDEEDFDGFAKLQAEIPEVKLVGDDLTVTNSQRLKKAIEKKSIKVILIKPNQIGTLSETIKTISMARENNIDCIVSHRSGETMDDFIADLVFAYGCLGLKSGAWGPKERNVKYERLIKITQD